MILLLDTNAFLWAVSDVAKLGKRAKKYIENPANKVYLSDVTLLEIAIKKRIGKLEIDIDLGKIDDIIAAADIQQIDFTGWIAQHFIDLPNLDWADPFDMAAIAAALAKHITLVTSDHKILTSNIPDLRTIDAKK